MSTSTSTTLPEPGTPLEVLGRDLEALVSSIESGGMLDLGELEPAVLKKLRKALDAIDLADDACQDGKRPRAAKLLRRALKNVASAGKKVRSKRGQREIEPTHAAAFLELAGQLESRLREMRASLVCPAVTEA